MLMNYSLTASISADEVKKFIKDQIEKETGRKVRNITPKIQNVSDDRFGGYDYQIVSYEIQFEQTSSKDETWQR